MALPMHTDISQPEGLHTGTVYLSQGGQLLIQQEAGLICAQCAASCLLEPQNKDKVLVAYTAQGEAWVIAVLHRSEAPATLLLPPDTTLCADKLHIAAPQLHVQSINMRLHAKALHMGGRVLLQTFENIRNVSRTLSVHALQKVAKYGNLREKVTQLAEYTMERVRHNVRTSLRMRSENMDLKAKKIVNVDGEHIKIG